MEVERLRGMAHVYIIQLLPHQFLLGIADRTESISQAALEHKKKSREFIHPSLGSTHVC